VKALIYLQLISLMKTLLRSQKLWKQIMI